MPLHILQFFSSLDSGGAENRMMDVYRCIDSSIIQFDFAVVNEGNHFFDEYIYSKGSKKYVFPNPHTHLIKNYKSLVSFFKNHPEFQAIHAHVNWYNGVVLFAAKKAGIKVRIAHARDAANPKRNLKVKMLSDIGKVLIRFSATQRIAISESAAENIFGKTVVRNKDYLFVPNALDQKKYKILTQSEREKIRRELGIFPNEKAYVTVATFRSKKNHKFLLDIANSLKQKQHSFKLFLIGDGEQRKNIEDKIAKLDLKNHVFLLGTRNDVPEILNAFDAMIFPSLYEGLGGVVLESQLVGVPAIVSDQVPKTADVDINMVEYISLSNSSDYWAEAVLEKVKNYSWNYNRALKAFEKKGYIIEQTTRKYLAEYGIETETIDKAMIF